MPSYAVNVEHQIAYMDTLSRTSKNSNGAIYNQPASADKSNFESSRFYEDNNIFNKFQARITALSLIKDNWNSHGSEAPSEKSINDAYKVLSSLRNHLLLPERVLPSAEGGVSFTFVSDKPCRGAIEVLNTGESYLLLYDLQGNSYVSEWPTEATSAQDALLDMLRTHLRSERLAAVSE
jgi:hypothetical protein